MSKEEADFLDDLRALSITAAHEFLSGIDRLKQLRNELTDSDGTPDPKRAARNELAFKLARSEIQRAEMLLSLSHTQADMLFDNAKKLIRRTRKDNEGPSKVLDLSFVNGHWQGELTVTNPFGAPADPRVEASTFRDGSGTELGSLGCLQLQTPRSVSSNGRVTLVFALPDKAAVAAGVFFADLDVFLVGDSEQKVAHRRVRLRNPVKLSAS